MAKSFLTDLNLNNNVLLNAKIQAWGTTPTGTTNPTGTGTAVVGQISTYQGSLYIFNNSNVWTLVGGAITIGSTAIASGGTSGVSGTPLVGVYLSSPVLSGTVATSLGNGKVVTTDGSGNLTSVTTVAAGNLPSATTSVSGIVQLNDTPTSGETSKAATSGSVYSVKTTADGALQRSGGTMTNFLTLNADPTSNLHAVTKQYVDTIATGLNAHDAVSYASTGTALTGTYNNGTSGVGATLTNSGTQAVFALDGYTFQASDVTNGTRVLLKDQGPTNADQNGIYVITTLGSASTNWVLTRATDYNSVPNVAAGDFAFVTSGNNNSKISYIQISKPAAISGNGTSANAITFSVFANGNISGTVSVTQGGTGQTSKANARGASGLSETGTALTMKYATAVPTTSTGILTITGSAAPYTYTVLIPASTHGVKPDGTNGTADMFVVMRDSSGNQVETDNTVGSTGTVTLVWNESTATLASAYRVTIIG
jgi:hypothetical protein